MNTIQEKGIIRPSGRGSSQASNQAEEEPGDGAERGGDVDRRKPVTSAWKGLTSGDVQKGVKPFCLVKARQVE